MADKNTKEATPLGDEQIPKKKLPIKTLLIILGVLLLEGGTITVVMRLRGGPAPAEATTSIGDTKESENKDMAEVVLAENFSIDNYLQGRARIMVTLEITAKVEKTKQDLLTTQVEEHKTEIKDKIRSLVSSADPEHLRDPNLQVIKREIKASMEQIVDEGLIVEILMPFWQTYTQN
jgi:flagellar basal body-associated protein FliL